MTQLHGNASRQLVLEQRQARQVAQLTQLHGNAPRQPVAGQIQARQVAQLTQLHGNAPRQLVVEQIQARQVAQVSQLHGNAPRQLVVAEVQGSQVAQLRELHRNAPRQLVLEELQLFQLGETCEPRGDRPSEAPVSDVQCGDAARRAAHSDVLPTGKESARAPVQCGCPGERIPRRQQHGAVRDETRVVSRVRHDRAVLARDRGRGVTSLGGGRRCQHQHDHHSGQPKPDTMSFHSHDSSMCMSNRGCGEPFAADRHGCAAHAARTALTVSAPV